MNEMIGLLVRQRILQLSPTRWRTFIEHAQRDRIDRKVLEIECVWDRAIMEDNFCVGAAREEFSKIPISLTPLPVGDDHFKEGNASSEPDERQATPAVGKLTYHPPIRAGMVNNKTGAVTGWFIMGTGNYADLLRRLAASPSPSFLIGLTVAFENQERTWDGNQPLEITEANLVFVGAAPEMPKVDDDAQQNSIPKGLLDEMSGEVRKIAKRLDHSLSLVIGILILMLIEMWVRR